MECLGRHYKPPAKHQRKINDEITALGKRIFFFFERKMEFLGRCFWSGWVQGEVGCEFLRRKKRIFEGFLRFSAWPNFYCRFLDPYGARRTLAAGTRNAKETRTLKTGFSFLVELDAQGLANTTWASLTANWKRNFSLKACT